MAVHDENLLYEIDEKGQRVLVRSIESNQRAYLRFTNRTSRPIDVWWRDFNGIKRHYIRLEPNAFYDVNSFVTHPWEFTDVATKEQYVINNKCIYRPPSNIGGMRYRTNWNVTVSVRPLRTTAMLALAVNIRSPCSVTTLGLPRVLSDELQALIAILHQSPPPPQRD